MLKKYAFAILMAVGIITLTACDDEEFSQMIEAANIAVDESLIDEPSPITEITSEEPTAQSPTHRPPIRISSSQAKELIQQTENLIIIDVRTPTEFAEGHIENAILLPLDNIVNTIIDAVPDKNQTIFIYCRSGNRSQTAMVILYDLGYTAVYELEGGILAWGGEITSKN